MTKMQFSKFPSI